MKIRSTLLLVSLVAPSVVACSESEHDNGGEPSSSVSIEYSVPDDLCEDELEVAVPKEFFPPGDNLRTHSNSENAYAHCEAYVDGEMFLRFQSNVEDRSTEGTIMNVNQFTDNSFPVEGEAKISQFAEYEIEAWSNLAIASRQCTSSSEGAREFHVLIGVKFTEDFKDPENTLTEFLKEPAEKIFNRIVYCEESEAHEGSD